MIYTVVLTRTAENDLQDAVDYIARVLDNRSAAESLLSQTEQGLKRLEDYPEAHPLVADTHLRERGIRVFTVNNYLGLYRIRAAERKVVLLRFLHGRRDWQSLLVEDIP